MSLFGDLLNKAQGIVGLNRPVAKPSWIPSENVQQLIRKTHTQGLDPSYVTEALRKEEALRQVASTGGFLGKLGQVANPVFDVLAIANQAKKVFNPTDNIITSVQNLGTSIQNLNKPLGQQNLYAGTDPYAVLRNRQIQAAKQGDRPIGTQSVLNGRPVQWTGSGWQELTGSGTSATLNALNAPGVQNRFIQDRPQLGAGSSSTSALPGGSPQDRAYHEAAISAAQQAAQNPLFQKYQVAELTKQYNAATTNEEKQRIGLQIWAQTNQKLASKLQPGQVGYAEAQTAPGMSNAGGNIVQNLPVTSINFNNSAFAAPSFIPKGIDFGNFVPGVGMTSATPQVNFDSTKALYTPINNTFTNFNNQTVNYDPAALAITENQRKTLIDYYASRLKPGLAK